MHPRLTVNGLIFRSTSIDLIAESCATAGIERVGLPSGVLVNEGGDRTVEVVTRHGLDVTHFPVDGLIDLVDEPSTVSDSALLALEVASRLGSRFIYGVTGSAVSLEWDEAAARFTKAVAPLQAASADTGVPVLFESTSSCLTSDVSFVHNFRDAVDLAEIADVRLCFDVNHCWTERGLGQSIRRAGDRIGAVQISDMTLGRRDRFRAVPGDGVIPLARILGTVLETGYSGLFDIEISPEPGIEPVHTLSRAVEQSEALLASLGL